MDRKAQVEQVISLIEQGNSEHSACAKVGINRNTFRAAAFKCLAADEYAKALAALARDQVESIEVAIAEMKAGEQSPMAARVEIDVRKWFASKFLPKVYGDKQEIEHSGAIGIGTPEQSLQYLVQIANQTPVQNPVIRKWLKDCLAAIPPLEGGD